jgi:hypothetical protein
MFSAAPVESCRSSDQAPYGGMTVSSRTPEGDFARCPTCLADFVIEPSLFFGDAPCPNCGQLVGFIRLSDRIHVQVSDADTYANRLVDYLQRRGLRITLQRHTVARLIQFLGSPFTADQLIDLTRHLPRDRWISPATVYRTLGELVNAKMLARTDDGRERQYIQT